jgi:hypothetical protein
MRIEIDYPPGAEVFTFWKDRLVFGRVTEVKMTIDLTERACIQCQIWTGSEHIRVLESECFEYEFQVRDALEKRFKELNK